MKREEVVSALWYLISDECTETQRDYKDEIRAAIDLLDGKAVWEYYRNDEGKARWRCSKCGKIIRQGQNEKLFCSHCGRPMLTER